MVRRKVARTPPRIEPVVSRSCVGARCSYVIPTSFRVLHKDLRTAARWRQFVHRRFRPV